MNSGPIINERHRASLHRPSHATIACPNCGIYQPVEVDYDGGQGYASLPVTPCSVCRQDLCCFCDQVSHHGDLDKGALRRPMLPEALALSLLDLMDARMEQVFRLIDSAPAGEEFTSYVPSLERQLFRGFDEPDERPQTVERGKAA